MSRDSCSRIYIYCMFALLRRLLLIIHRLRSCVNSNCCCFALKLILFIYLLTVIPSEEYYCIIRVTIRPDLGGTARFFRPCPGQIIKSPAFSFTQPAHLEPWYAKGSPDRLRNNVSEPYLNDVSGRKWCKRCSQAGDDLFFGDHHQRRD